MTTSSTIPEFLSGGTFVWRRAGYSLSAPLPQDVDDAIEPWHRLAATLEDAKQGRTGAVADLEQFVEPDAPLLLMRGSLMLMGDAGGTAAREAVDRAIGSESGEVALAACKAASFAGWTSSIPAMLDALAKASRQQDRDLITDSIGALLEDDDGPITDGEFFEPEDLRRHVDARLTELDPTASGAPLWEGRPFDVVELARRMDATLRQIDREVGVAGLFIRLRHKFEATTGIDCRAFFDGEGLFQPLSALAIVEDFLESDRPLHFAAGQRYFFGHRVEG